MSLNQFNFFKLTMLLNNSENANFFQSSTKKNTVLVITNLADSGSPLFKSQERQKFLFFKPCQPDNFT